MMRSPFPALLAVLEYGRTNIYRELSDIYWGFPGHLRWFIMRKVARFESMKSLVNFIRYSSLKTNSKKDVSPYEMSIFQDFDVDHVVSCLRRDGIYQGLSLPKEIVEQILQFAGENRCYGNRKPHLGFYHREKNIISHDLNINLTSADYYNTSNCKSIQMVVKDEGLLKIAQMYLGGIPIHQGTNLRWTFGMDLSEFDRYRSNQTFHYDLDDYSAMKFFFYLTDVSIEDGPHICILGSHKSKRFLHRILRGIYNEDKMVNYYKIENVITICGNSGYGFAEDAFIMHKGLNPMKNDRLILIIEYALEDYNLQHDHIQESELKSVL